jgi:hypothetical protein
MSLKRKCHKQKIQVAEETPFDNSGTDFTSDNVQGAITEVGASASPGFDWGRSGLISPGDYLHNQGVPSNRSGNPIPITNPVAVLFTTRNTNTNGYTLEFFEHDGSMSGAVSLGTVVVPPGVRGLDLNINVALTKGRQIAAQLIAGLAFDIVAGLVIKGSN